MLHSFNYILFLKKHLPMKLQLEIAYFKKHHKFVNLRNPKTLNEKIVSSMLYGYKPFHTTVADKYLVREYVQEKIGCQYLIPLIKVIDDAKDFTIDDLPKSFIIKSNNGSGNNKIVKNKNNIDINEVRALINDWLSKDYYSSSYQPEYKDIKSKVLIEKLLFDSNGKVPNDYKFHCIKGKVEFIQIIEDRFENPQTRFYYTDWKQCPFFLEPIGSHFTFKSFKETMKSKHAINRTDQPNNLNDMIDVAERLASDFDYVRIDLYSLHDVIYFGEITLHPYGGMNRFVPEYFDLYYGGKCQSM